MKPNITRPQPGLEAELRDIIDTLTSLLKRVSRFRDAYTDADLREALGRVGPMIGEDLDGFAWAGGMSGRAPASRC